MAEIVPKDAVIVRLKRNLSADVVKHRYVGCIFKTIRETTNGCAQYSISAEIPTHNWRYATALEIYCFNKHKIDNVSEITTEFIEEFTNYIKNKQDGSKENDLQRIETTRPSAVRPRAIGLRQPTKQVANGSRFVGNETKGKYLKQRVESVIIKANPIKF